MYQRESVNIGKRWCLQRSKWREQTQLGGNGPVELVSAQFPIIARKNKVKERRVNKKDKSGAYKKGREASCPNSVGMGPLSWFWLSSLLILPEKTKLTETRNHKNDERSCLQISKWGELSKLGGNGAGELGVQRPDDKNNLIKDSKEGR